MGDKPSNAPEVAMVTLIRVRHVIGAGIVSDPVRRIEDYYHKDGAFLMRRDPYDTKERAHED